MGLIHQPQLVFLDEPSTGLDPQSRANLWHHIRKLRDEFGTTVFLTTHYMDEADSLSDRLLIIDHGTIVGEGTSAELKAQISGDSLTFTLRDDDEAAKAADSRQHARRRRQHRHRGQCAALPDSEGRDRPARLSEATDRGRRRADRRGDRPADARRCLS